LDSDAEMSRIASLSTTRKKINHSGEKNPSWKGGRIRIRGYVLVYCPDHPHRVYKNHIWEHRLIMENYLGRYLEKNEVVHHINGIKDDNRIENLQLFRTDSEHHLQEWKNGVYSHIIHAQYSEIIRKIIIEYVEDGHSYREAVLTFSISYNTIKGWCLLYGIRSKYSHLTNAQIEEIINLRSDGLTYRTIEKKTGTPIGTISRNLRRKRNG